MGPRNISEGFGGGLLKSVQEMQPYKYTEWAKHKHTRIGLVFYATSGAGVLRPPATYLNVSTVAVCCPRAALCEPYVGPMLAYVGPMLA